MAYEEAARRQARPHILSIDGREKLSVSGVVDVIGFDENLVVLSTTLGELNVRGEGLHVDRIDLDSGNLEVRGRIAALGYDDRSDRPSVWSKLFG